MALALDAPLPPTVTEASPRAQQPPGLLLPLKEHQLAMLHKCAEIEKRALMSPYKMGFMADPVAAGKCFAKGTPVLLFSGESRRVEDVRVGDQLMGDDSTPRNVLALGRGHDELFTVAGPGASPYTVNSEHILCLAADDHGRVAGASLTTYDPEGERRVEDFGSAEEAERARAALTGDGVSCLTVSRLLALAPEARARFRGYRRPVRFGHRDTARCPWEAGVEAACSGVPLSRAYMVNSAATRLRVLGGMADARGELAGGGLRLALGDDVAGQAAELAWGVGLAAGREPGGVTLSGPGLHLVAARRREVRPGGDGGLPERTTHPVEVAASGRGEYFGFSIDGNRRFMLPDFTVTHNTAVAVGMQVAERQAFGRRSLNMVVVPQNICMQWRDEIAKFAGDLLAVHMVVGYADLNLLTGPAALSKFDVLLTTPSFFVTLAEFCEQYQVAPRRVVVDEADTICNMISRQIPGAMTWFLSATMDRLPESKAAMVQIGKYVTGVEDLNAPADGQNSVRTRSGGVLRAQEYGTYEIPARLLRSGERVCRCEPGWIARGFGIPSPTAKTIVCSNVIIDMLACLTFARLETDTARLLQPQQLESANARDFRNLRTGVVTDDEFLLVPALLRRHVANGAEAKDNLASLAGVVNMEQRAAECKAQAALAAEYVAVIRENAAKTLLCQATFEQLALPDRGKPPVERCYSCPACGAGYCAPWAEAHAGSGPRGAGGGHPCLRCGSDEALVERTLGPPALAVNKVTRLAETIRAVAGSEGAKPRVVVFAKYTQAFSALRDELEGSGLVIKEADAGTPQAAHRMISDFRAGAVDVLLAESSLFCSGMNLPEVTDVCFLHAVHPYTAAQIAGRAQRPGRQAPCRLWTFLHDNELPAKPRE